MTIHRVYWTDTKIHSKDELDLGKALQLANILRNQGARFVVISSEIDECTSLQGVSSPPEDYSWKKRR